MLIFNNFIYYIGALFLGWGLGANDSANIFGTAVSSRMVKFRIAVVSTALFVILGALIQGKNGIETIAFSLDEKTKVEKTVRHQEKVLPLVQIKKKESLEEAMIVTFGAALAIFFMTVLRLPVSTSQAIVGAIVGIGIMRNYVNLQGITKVVLCWLGTPLGGILFTVVFYYLFRFIFNRLKLNLIQYDYVIRVLLIVSGCYGAYSLGANNVANVTAVFVKAGALTVFQAALFGGIAIAIGVCTYSKPVMQTVGFDIIKLDSFMAFITVLSLAVTVYIYALIGVPVSTTQAIVGAVFGFGIIKGVQTINFRTLKRIAIGWILTPVLGGILAAVGYFISNLFVSDTFNNSKILSLLELII